ncbi:hypothetical protein D9M70_593740 [compost metagenome]
MYLPSKKRTIAVPEGSILNMVDAATGPMTGKLQAKRWFAREPDDMILVEHALAVEGDYPYTLGLLLLPDAIPRWEREDDPLLTPVDQALRYRR